MFGAGIPDFELLEVIMDGIITHDPGVAPLDFMAFNNVSRWVLFRRINMF